MSNKAAQQNPAHEHIALVLQGGGALGAYQAGVYEEIAKIPREPHWVAGISIGAINAALIAGNPPALRVTKLREFWELASSRFSDLAPPQIDLLRSPFHQFSAGISAVLGVPGFYQPRLIPPAWQLQGTDGAISIYDAAPLRQTLERLIDFDLINQKKTRLSVGAVNVRTGNSVFFDNLHQRIGPEHIMASGALPPAFAPVAIDGELYWDGGIVSNTPLQYVLDNRSCGRLMIVQVDLFNARGEAPTTLSAALIRQKDIVYSSRTRFNTDQAARIESHRCDIAKLIARLPPEFQDDTEITRLKACCKEGHIDIVHLIYRQNEFELESKDYEFSRSTVDLHWQAGRQDMLNTAAHPDWLTKSEGEHGITIYDLSHDVHHPPTEEPPHEYR